MNTLFNRWLPCITLAAWSTALLVFYFTGRVNNLLAPPFRPGVLIAGIVLAIMALVFVVFRADASCCSSAECGHSLSRLASGKILTFLILIVPLGVSAKFSPDSFGKTLIENRGTITDIESLGIKRRSGPPAPAPTFPLPSKDGAQNSEQPPADPDRPMADADPAEPDSTTPPAPDPAAQQPIGNISESASDYLTRTPEGYIVTEVLDLLYAAQDTVLRKDFEGKKIQLIGQLMPEPSTQPGQAPRLKAVRMFMTCCAADARPIATVVETDKLPDLPEMTWIKIIGVPTFPVENGRRVSILKAEKVEKTEPPEEAMIF